MISKKKKKEIDLEIDFDDSLIEDSSEEICLPQIIKTLMRSRQYSEIQCPYYHHCCHHTVANYYCWVFPKIQL